MSDRIQCIFDGRAFNPATPYQLRIARDRFGEGEIVMMAVENERSWRSHAHQFATIADLWQTLPDHLSEMPYAKSAETLRKHALIETGYADCETIDAGSKAAAERVGASISRMATLAHGYCIVKVSGSVVRCYTPHSQSVRSMGAKVFQESKTAVLGWIEELLARAAA
ncbi:hypothetical protein [Thauera sp.]|uniref:hypothetical protein n=1 Tax=Thauera sp. TaxID=1905334 RepID=UPI002C5AE8DB|nr:hypothetical protein [Thauera sp.]HRP26383.1 hypothetical protein [Thauera sp.]